MNIFQEILDLIPAMKKRRLKKEAEKAAELARAIRWQQYRQLAFNLGYIMRLKNKSGYREALRNFLDFLRENDPNATEDQAREFAIAECAARACGR